MSWKDENGGPYWVPVLNATERKYGIPTDLLARVAYQESHFIRGVINGTTKSSAGAMGIMQLLPSSFPGVVVGKWPKADINVGGGYLKKMYELFNDWQLSLAGYNWGPGNLRHWLRKDYTPPVMPTEVLNYVREIVADVPIAGALVVV